MMSRLCFVCKAVADDRAEKHVLSDRVADVKTVKINVRGKGWRESGLSWVGWSVDKDGVRVRASEGHRDVSSQHTADGKIRNMQVNEILRNTTKRMRGYDKVFYAFKYCTDWAHNAHWTA